jgi:DNA-binding beta-propeller fold protein YncE
MRVSGRQLVHAAAIIATAVVLLAPARMSARAFPDLIQLPAGFGPEGIAVGNGTTFYVGSLAATSLGQILEGDLRTGALAELVPANGVPVTGIKHDPRSNLLFVARAASGRGTVFDAASGAQVAAYQFQTAPTFINDVVITRDAAYFTDTAAPFLYRVALGPRGMPAADFTRIALPGDFRTNGIVATPNGDQLLVVNGADARLYRIDPATGTAVAVDLGASTLPNADGLLLRGKTLYVVQNRLNRVAVVELSADLTAGELTRFITEPFASNPLLQVPTTIAAFGNALYAVTAGFAAPTPDYVVRMAN